jgi:hypothetical protein
LRLATVPSGRVTFPSWEGLPAGTGGGGSLAGQATICPAAETWMYGLITWLGAVSAYRSTIVYLSPSVTYGSAFEAGFSIPTLLIFDGREAGSMIGAVVIRCSLGRSLSKAGSGVFALAAPSGVDFFASVAAVSEEGLSVPCPLVEAPPQPAKATDGANRTIPSFTSDALVRLARYPCRLHLMTGTIAAPQSLDPCSLMVGHGNTVRLIQMHYDQPLCKPGRRLARCRG